MDACAGPSCFPAALSGVACLRAYMHAWCRAAQGNTQTSKDLQEGLASGMTFSDLFKKVGVSAL